MTVAKAGQAPTHDPSVNNQVDGTLPDETAPATIPQFSVATAADVQPIAIPITPPWLAIVHPTGDLATSGKFMQGSLVLGKEYLIAKAGEPLKMIIWSYQVYFKEYISSADWTAGKRPRVFMSEADAHAAGLTTRPDLVTRTLPSCPMAMSWLMLVEKPESVLCDYFFLDVNGKKYAPAVMGIEKTAFTSVKNNFQLANLATRPHGGIKAMLWEMKTQTYTAKTGNKSWVPAIKGLRIMPGTEIQEFVKAAALLAGDATTPEEAL